MTNSTDVTRRPMSIDDLYEIELVGEPAVSPSRKAFAWVQTRLDRAREAYGSAIWISIDGGSPRKLTSGLHRDTAPAWSPDGMSLAFVSNRPHPNHSKDNEPAAGPPTTQIWLVRTDGGEPTCVTNAPHGAKSPVWNPDGGSIAFVASDDPTENECSTAPTSLGPVADERIIRDIQYRADGQGYLDRFAHIWTVQLSDLSTSQITFGPYQDSQPAWSPEGDAIAFCSNRSENARLTPGRSAIHVANVNGDACFAISLEDARFSSPSWSPDGAHIAFSGHLGAQSSTLDGIWTVAADGAQLTNHTENSDLECADVGMSDVSGSGDSGPKWAGQTRIVFAGSANGETQIHDVDLPTGAIHQRTSGKHRIAGFDLAGDDLLVVRGTVDRPFELELWKNDSSTSSITNVNAGFRERVAIMGAEDLTLSAPDGTSIQGWLIPPAGYSPESPGKHPLIVQIHGGPHAMYGYALFHEMQVMAARGYAVAFCNPRGSAGYGAEFQACTKGNWGTADMPDVIALVDAVCQKDWIDNDRIGITGGSYGGYLTNWIIGHDDRFKAAVTQRCVSSFLSFFGTSDIGTTFGVDEFDGLPWTDTEKLFRHSPIAYVEQMHAPLLILHSEQDLRCPIEQAEQLFASLNYLGRTTEFVRFPEEGHELSRTGTPSRRVARLTHLLGWFDRHL